MFDIFVKLASKTVDHAVDKMIQAMFGEAKFSAEIRGPFPKSLCADCKEKNKIYT